MTFENTAIAAATSELDAVKDAQERGLPVQEHEPTKNQSYRVTLYAVVRVPVEVYNVASQLDAIEKAMASVDLHKDFRRGEFAEDVVNVLVDEQGDGEHLNSTTYAAEPSTGAWVAEPSCDAHEPPDEGSLHEASKHDMLLRATATPVCKVCGGRGSSLPADCPGHDMTELQNQGVMLGTLDYRAGRWVEVANSAQSFHLLHAELQSVKPDSHRADEITAILNASDYTFDSRLGCIPNNPLVIPHDQG